MNNQETKVAIKLGLFGLMTNLLGFLIIDNFHIYAGIMFSFLCAQTLRTKSALLCCLIATLPTLFFNPVLFDIVRQFAQILLVAYIYQKSKSISVTLPFGIFSLSSAVFTSWHFGSSLNVSLMVASGEMLLLLLTNVLLLDTRIWGIITNRGKQIELKEFVASTGTVVMLAGYFITLLLLAYEDVLRFSPESLIVVTPLLVGMFLPLVLLYPANWLQNNLELFGNSRKARSNLSGTNFKSEDFLSVNEVVNQQNKNIGIIAFNADDSINFVNRLAKQQLKINTDDLIGKNINEIEIDSKFKTTLSKILEACKKNGFKKQELKVGQLPEPIKYLELTACSAKDFPMASLSCASAGHVITIKDITAKRSVELNVMEGQKIASLGTSLQGIAHSLNNYLTSIVGHLSNLKNSHVNEELNQALALSLSASTQAGQLLRQLLEYTEKRPFKLESIELNAVVKENSHIFSNALGPNGKINWDIAETPINSYCDKNLLTQAIVNVIRNAQEAYPVDTTPQVTISLSEEELLAEMAELIPGALPGHYARISIQDKGYGMTSDILRKAFEPMYGTKKNQGQPGLGLSVVYSIVRAHDGFMSVESQANKGTTVALYFPIADNTSRTKQVSSALKAPEIGSTKAILGQQILIVEDDQQVLKVVSKMLSSLGYQVQECSNAEEAIQLCNQKEFDLILTDMMMPEMSGCELINVLNSRNNKAKLLLMTGCATTQISDSQNNPILAKPFDMQTLASAVAQALQ